MATCDVCGKDSLFPETIGELTLCKLCSMKILAPTWRNNTYTSNDEVLDDRERAIKLAVRSRFPDSAVAALGEYFDEQIVEGLVKTFEGGAGQDISLFEDHLTIDTYSSFDAAAAFRAFRMMTARSLTAAENEQRMAEATELLLKGMASGKTTKKEAALTCAGIASEMLENQMKVAASIPNPEVRSGAWSWRYSFFRDVTLILPSSEDSSYGFIQLQRGKELNPAKDLVFFFKQAAMSKGDPEQLRDLLYRGIADNAEERVQRIRESRRRRASGSEEARTVVMQPQVSAPEELLKWKQLLDAGAISQDEYDAKKAQLLNL